MCDAWGVGAVPPPLVRDRIPKHLEVNTPNKVYRWSKPLIVIFKHMVSQDLKKKNSNT